MIKALAVCALASSASSFVHTPPLQPLSQKKQYLLSKNTHWNTFSSTQSRYPKSNHNNNDLAMREHMQLNALSSFQGSVWLDEYDSPFSEPIEQYGSLLIAIEALSENGALQDEKVNKRIKKCVNSIVNLEKVKKALLIELEQGLEKNKSNTQSQLPGLPNHLTVKDHHDLFTYRPVTQKGLSYEGDIPLHLKMKSFFNKKDLDQYLPDNGIKYLNKQTRDSRAHLKVIAAAFEKHGIPKEFLSTAGKPYLYGILNNAIRMNYLDGYEGLKVNDKHKRQVPLLEFIFNLPQRKKQLKEYLTQASTPQTQRFDQLKDLLSPPSETDYPLTLADLLTDCIRWVDIASPITIDSKQFEALEPILDTFKSPIEIILIDKLMCNFPEKELVNYFEDCRLQPRGIKALLQIGKMIESLSASDLSWLFETLLDNGKLDQDQLFFKLDLLVDHFDQEALDSYWHQFSNNNSFDEFLFILKSRLDQLKHEKREELEQVIVNFIASQKLKAEDKKSLLENNNHFPLMLSKEKYNLLLDELKADYKDPDPHLATQKLSQIMMYFANGRNIGLLNAIFDELQNVSQPSDKKKQKILVPKISDQINGPYEIVSGIRLPIEQNSIDKYLIPSMQSAKLVMTPTATKILRNLAGQWRTGNPVLLEGPTSAGKTSYIKFLSALTKTPYRRINLSYNTDVRDLIGRWVNGEKRYSEKELEALSSEELTLLAKSMGMPSDERQSLTQLRDEIYQWQQNPHWEDGPVIHSLRKAETLLFDEINLAKPQVIEILNGLLDSGKIVLDDNNGEIVEKHPNTRIFGTMNPSTYVGRNNMSDAFKSRWATRLWVDQPKETDIAQIITELYPKVIPKALLAPLIVSHANLSEMADQRRIGKTSGGMTYTLRNLFRVVERFNKFHPRSTLSDAALLRREFDEVYLSPINHPKELQLVQDALVLDMPAQSHSFYKKLDFKVDKNQFTIGDLTVQRLPDTGHGLIPKLDALNVVMTDRTKEVLYKMAKSLEMDEPVALVGERASGKTLYVELYAALKRQPFYRQIFSEKSDNMELIGMYTPSGWQDGLLLKAGRCGPNPGVILLDEFNQANDAVQERLNSLLDKDRKLYLTERGGGEEVPFDPNFRCVAAYNPPGSAYSGRKQLSMAMQSRLAVQSVSELKDKHEILEIMNHHGQQRGISKGVINALVNLHFFVLQGVKEKKLGRDGLHNNYIFSIRQLNSALDIIEKLSDELGGPKASFSLASELIYEAPFENEKDKATIRALTKGLYL